MPAYQIHRLKDVQRQQFRWAPHTSGACIVKPRDYEPDSTIEADTVYTAWHELRGSKRPLQIGDMLEGEAGALYICKYVGFEEARWIVPEPTPAAAVENGALEPTFDGGLRRSRNR